MSFGTLNISSGTEGQQTTLNAGWWYDSSGNRMPLTILATISPTMFDTEGDANVYCTVQEVVQNGATVPVNGPLFYGSGVTEVIFRLEVRGGWAAATALVSAFV